LISIVAYVIYKTCSLKQKPGKGRLTLIYYYVAQQCQMEDKVTV